MNLTKTRFLCVSYDFKQFMKDLYITKHSIAAHERQKTALTVLSKIIKMNRWELFNSSSGYKIITNGYSEYKHVEIDGDVKLTDLKIIEPMFNEVESLEMG